MNGDKVLAIDRETGQKVRLSPESLIQYAQRYERVERGPYGPAPGATPGFEETHEAAAAEGLPVQTAPFVERSLYRESPIAATAMEHLPEAAAMMIPGTGLPARLVGNAIRALPPTKLGLSIGLPGSGGMVRVQAPGLINRALREGMATGAEVGTGAGVGALEGAGIASMSGEDPMQGAQSGLAAGALGGLGERALRAGTSLASRVIPGLGERLFPEIGQRRRAAAAASDAAEAARTKEINQKLLETRKANEEFQARARQRTKAFEEAGKEQALEEATRKAQGETYLATTNIFQAPIKDVHSMHQYLVRDAGRTLARDEFLGALAEVETRVPKMMVERMGQKGPEMMQVPTRELLENLTEAGAKRKLGKFEGPEKSYRELREEIRSQLPPDVLETFDQAQAQMARRMGMRAVAELNPGIFKAGGVTEAPSFDPEAFRQALFNPRTVKQVERRIGEDNFEALLRAVGAARP